MRRTLASYWGVANRKQLVDILGWLRDEGHRAEYEALVKAMAEAGPLTDPAELLAPEAAHEMGPDDLDVFRNKAAFAAEHGREQPSILAWDLCRLVSVARFGAAAGYFPEAEAWSWILEAARRLRAAFASWCELGDNYMTGRGFWAQQGGAEAIARFKRIHARLIDPTNASSPWNQITWNGN